MRIHGIRYGTKRFGRDYKSRPALAKQGQSLLNMRHPSRLWSFVFFFQLETAHQLLLHRVRDGSVMA